MKINKFNLLLFNHFLNLFSDTNKIENNIDLIIKNGFDKELDFITTEEEKDQLINLHLKKFKFLINSKYDFHKTEVIYFCNRLKDILLVLDNEKYVEDIGVFITSLNIYFNIISKNYKDDNIHCLDIVLRNFKFKNLYFTSEYIFNFTSWNKFPTSFDLNESILINSYLSNFDESQYHLFFNNFLFEWQDELLISNIVNWNESKFIGMKNFKFPEHKLLNLYCINKKAIRILNLENKLQENMNDLISNI